MTDDKQTVNPTVDRSELRGRILGNLNQMRSSIDNAHNYYEIFHDLGVTPESLNAPNQVPMLISKMVAMRNALALRWHPDKSPNKEDLERWTKVQEALDILQDRQKRAAYDNKKAIVTQPASFEMFSPDENHSSPNSSHPLYQIRPNFSVNDIIQEFKDFYKEKTGKEFSPETAAAEGYAYLLNTDMSGNNILQLTCPDTDTRNECIQRFLDKNMIASPWQALKESVLNERAEESPASKAKSPFESPLELPRLERAAPAA
jgi:hypothetical protein